MSDVDLTLVEDETAAEDAAEVNDAGQIEHDDGSRECPHCGETYEGRTAGALLGKHLKAHHGQEPAGNRMRVDREVPRGDTGKSSASKPKSSRPRPAKKGRTEKERRRAEIADMLAGPWSDVGLSMALPALGIPQEMLIVEGPNGRPARTELGNALAFSPQEANIAAWCWVEATDGPAAQMLGAAVAPALNVLKPVAVIGVGGVIVARKVSVVMTVRQQIAEQMALQNTQAPQQPTTPAPSAATTVSGFQPPRVADDDAPPYPPRGGKVMSAPFGSGVVPGDD